MRNKNDPRKRVWEAIAKVKENKTKTIQIENKIIWNNNNK